MWSTQESVHSKQPQHLNVEHTGKCSFKTTPASECGAHRKVFIQNNPSICIWSTQESVHSKQPQHLNVEQTGKCPSICMWSTQESVHSKQPQHLYMEHTGKCSFKTTPASECGAHRKVFIQNNPSICGAHRKVFIQNNPSICIWSTRESVHSKQPQHLNVEHTGKCSFKTTPASECGAHRKVFIQNNPSI